MREIFIDVYYMRVHMTEHYLDTQHIRKEETRSRAESSPKFVPKRQVIICHVVLCVCFACWSSQEMYAQMKQTKFWLGSLVALLCIKSNNYDSESLHILILSPSLTFDSGFDFDIVVDCQFRAVQNVEHGIWKNGILQYNE